MTAIGMRPKSAVAPAVLTGLVVAMAVIAMPVGFIETIVASSGLSEAWALAGPPLGLKARLLLAGFGALMAMGFVWAARQDHGAPPSQARTNRRVDRAAGVDIMGFALPKLSWLSRRRPAGSTRVVRRADSHPDAPARTPIFASRDFSGIDISPRATDADKSPAAQQDSVILSLPRFAAEPVVYADYEEIAEPVPEPVVASTPRPLSIAELTARLESGLARRARATPDVETAPAKLADMPIEPAIPVRDRVEDDVDEALRQALTALRALTERPR